MTAPRTARPSPASPGLGRATTPLPPRDAGTFPAGDARREGPWQDQALCAEVDLELFFPDKGVQPSDAKRVCALCTVRSECLTEALKIGADGVWGGTTPRQRQRLGGTIYASATAYLPPPECGTDAAQQRHRRAGQTCDKCGVGMFPVTVSRETDSYPGGPRVLARQLGLSFPSTKQLVYEQVEDLAVRAYWRKREKRQQAKRREAA